MKARPPPSPELVLVAAPGTAERLALCQALAREGFDTCTAERLDADRLRAGLDVPDLVVATVDPAACGSPIPWEGDPSTWAWPREVPVVVIAPPMGTQERRRLLDGFAVEVLEAPLAPERVVERVRVYARLQRACHRALSEQAVRIEALRDAQQSLLPRAEDLPEARFEVTYCPVHEAGGDYYDVFPLGPAKHGYLVADVSGHDLGASYVTAALKALVAASVRQEADLDGVLARINAGLRPLLAEGRYLTACLAYLDRFRGRLQVACAGHPRPILVTGSRLPRLLPGSGDVLGVFPEVHIETVEVPVRSGDRLFLFTDGLLRASGGTGGRSHEALESRLLEQADRTRGLPLGLAVAESVIQVVSPVGQPADDLVLLGVDV